MEMFEMRMRPAEILLLRNEMPQAEELLWR
jgi:hypothetical protein